MSLEMAMNDNIIMSGEMLAQNIYDLVKHTLEQHGYDVDSDWDWMEDADREDAAMLAVDIIGLHDSYKIEKIIYDLPMAGVRRYIEHVEWIDSSRSDVNTVIGIDFYNPTSEQILEMLSEDASKEAI